MQSNKNKVGVLFIGVAFMILLTFISCSKKIMFNTSTVAPAARGYIQVKKDNNENYSIDVKISDLAEVERLQGGKKNYVVWMVSNGDSGKNIGQINSNVKMISKKLVASFHSVSSTKPTRIFITAEEDGTAQYPGNTIVLSTDTF